MDVGVSLFLPGIRTTRTLGNIEFTTNSQRNKPAKESASDHKVMANRRLTLVRKTSGPTQNAYVWRTSFVCVKDDFSPSDCTMPTVPASVDNCRLQNELVLSVFSSKHLVDHKSSFVLFYHCRARKSAT